MVLQYANNGCLRDYLRNNFNSLQWKDKIQMALDITCGIMCLHSENIIHCDLVNKKKILYFGRVLVNNK